MATKLGNAQTRSLAQKVEEVRGTTSGELRVSPTPEEALARVRFRYCTPSLPAARPRLMKPRHILIVDDEPAVLQALARALTRRGHVVFTAMSGEEACQLLASQGMENYFRFLQTGGVAPQGVDAILMDLQMPEMSGQTLFHVILSQWPDLAPRVAVMSGDPNAEDHQAWLRLYRLPMISKPFELGQVFQIVELLTTEERHQANGG